MYLFVIQQLHQDEPETKGITTKGEGGSCDRLQSFLLIKSWQCSWREDIVVRSFYNQKMSLIQGWCEQDSRLEYISICIDSGFFNEAESVDDILGMLMK